MRIAVASNSTMNPLAGLLPHDDVVVSGVGDLVRWLVDPSSPAADEATDLVLVCPDGESLVPPLGDPALADELLERIEDFARRRPGVAVVVTTLLLTARSPLSQADATVPSARFATRARWESQLAALAAELPNLNVLDLRALAERHGSGELVNDSYWYLGRIRFSSAGFEAVAAELGELQAGLTNRARKVLVLDLDNTLWGGVVGEDGVGGIALGEEGAGKCHRDLQRQILALKDAGTLLAVVSKNDADLVDEVFERNPNMVLGPADFVAVSADWSDKASRIRALADSLSLGLDAFVFVDDNPVERELVATELPEVAVPEFPTSPERLPVWFAEDVVRPWFPRTRILVEDRNKTGQYQARRQRHEAEATDLEGFLAGLEIGLTFRPDDETLIPRVSQLTQKTNQFNLTTERLTPADVKRLIDSPDHLVLACDYRDRFGDEGTIGVALVDLAAGELANLLLSCRVLGRNVEDELLVEVQRHLRKRDHDRIRARFVPSARNGVASSFLQRAGFEGSTTDAGWTGEKEID